MADIVTAPAKDRSEVARPAETTRGPQFTPRVDIYETDRELTLFAEMPGVRPDDVDLRYENGELLLHGRVRPREGKGGRQPLLNEYQEGDFYRVFTIHESIDAGKIAAECKNGLLTVHLPKVEAAQPRKIGVKAQ
jgi:HSP20 family molecular chaperone IbpA